MQSGIIGHFVFEKLDKNRSEFKGITFDQLVSKMDKNDIYFNDFQKYLSKNGLELDLSKSKFLVKRFLTAELARQLFDENKYYQIVLKEDSMIKKVIEN